MGLIKTYSVAAIVTVIIWAATYIGLGLDALVTVIILTLLEVTFSFDNAVMNARVLETMSHFWRMLFLTVGIVFAVFIVRFLLPLFIVGLTANIDVGAVIKLATEHPAQYTVALEHATPVIEAFGGTFLLLVGISYFIDDEKSSHWLRPIERWLSRVGRIKHFAFMAMVFLTAIIYLTIHTQQAAILTAGLIALALHGVMILIDKIFAGKPKSIRSKRRKTGLAAFSAFLYLQLLDASFSLDSVIGAFAITTTVLLIVAGLGAGAVWVRSMTVHLVEIGALKKYRYLEHGAHWAIIALGAIMIAKLYGFEPPDWLTGAIGLVFIALSILSSKFAKL